MHSGPDQIEGDLAGKSAPLRLVRVRLTLALVAMAFLPIAVAAPLVVTALDGQRTAERLGVEQDSSSVASEIGTRLERFKARLVAAAGAGAILDAADGERGATADAKAAIASLSDAPGEGLLSAALLDTRGREIVKAVDGHAVKTASTTVVDPLVGAALQAGRGEVSAGPVQAIPGGAASVGLAVPVVDGPDGTTRAIVRIQLSLSEMLTAATAQMEGAGNALLVDGAGAFLADTKLAPGSAPVTPESSEQAGAGHAIVGSAPVRGTEGWIVRIVARSAFSSPPFPLFVLLGLAVTGLILLVAFMARQVLRPAEELEQSRSRLRDLYAAARVDAVKDPITGLGNHRAFQEEFDRQLDASRMRQRALSVVLIDLDDFRSINDARGHAGGDEALTAFGRIVLNGIRPSDRGFRTGGDEFALLLPGTGADAAVAMTKRLLSSAVDRRHGRPDAVALPFSAGIAVSPGSSVDRRQLLTQADAALSWAKKHGRTMVEVFDPDRHGQLQVATSVADLSAAVANVVARRLVRAVYQPIVELASGRVIGYEGLVRPLPASGFADASSLFAAAEAGGRTFELDAVCLATVANGAAKLSPDSTLTLNLSPRTLESEAFSAGGLATLARQSGLDPSRIVLELTEREQIEEMARLRRNAAACRAEGFRLAADDVGAGNAGLRLLSQIQFDIVKIDLSLVQEGAIHEASLQVVGALKDLARRWGATVIAEGIETPEQLQVVRELEIELGQGFLLGRPGSAADLATIEMTAVDIPAILGRDDWLHQMARAGAGIGAPSTAR